MGVELADRNLRFRFDCTIEGLVRGFRSNGSLVPPIRPYERHGDDDVQLVNNWKFEYECWLRAFRDAGCSLWHRLPTASMRDGESQASVVEMSRAPGKLTEYSKTGWRTDWSRPGLHGQRKL